MSAATAAGVLLIAMPLAFNVTFGMLASRFDYPDVLRLPTAEVLSRFRDGGRGLILLWWAFALTAVLFAPLVVVLAGALEGSDRTLLAVSTAIGVLAALVQFLGLIRWPFLVPYLAEADADPGANPARREAIDLVFQSFNRYLGVAVGEHLGYALTGLWTLLTGAAMLGSSALADALGVAGLLIGPVFLVCALEFVGRGADERGWKPAERLTPITYVAWSVWLAATGVALLV